MVISILSVSVEALEMLCAAAAEALAPWAWELKSDNLLNPFASDLRLQEVKFKLYQL